MEFQYEDHRIYQLDENGKLLAEITFPLIHDHIEINHTYVSESLRGQGVAAQLVKAAVDTIRSHGWLMVPTCSYAKAWMEKHEEEQDILFQK